MIRLVTLALALGVGVAAAELLDRVEVVVEDDIITLQELDERIKIIEKQIQQSNTPLPPRDQLADQVLDYMVIARLQLQLAKKRGISLPPGAVDQEVQSIAERNGMNPEQFQREVEHAGIDYADFREYLREQMLVQHLQQLESRYLIRVTEDEIDNFLRLHMDRLQTDTRYQLGHILVAVSGQTSPEEVEQFRKTAQSLRDKVRAGEHFASLALTESDGRNALNGGDIGWRTEVALPDFAAETIAALAVGEITDELRSPSGFHLFHLRDKEDGTQVMVNQTLVRHILVQTNDLIDDAEARSRLQTLRGRIDGGDRFEDLARSRSDDTASAVDGGSLGWRSPGELDPYFTEQMDRLEIGAVSEPFRTSFGWHILQVQDRQRVDETEQALRTRALNHLARSRVGDEIEIWLRRMLRNSYVRYLSRKEDA